MDKRKRAECFDLVALGEIGGRKREVYGVDHANDQKWCPHLPNAMRSKGNIQQYGRGSNRRSCDGRQLLNVSVISQKVNPSQVLCRRASPSMCADIGPIMEYFGPMLVAEKAVKSRCPWINLDVEDLMKRRLPEDTVTSPISAFLIQWKDF